MSLPVSHWIRGYAYDENGDAIAGMYVTASTVSGNSTATVGTVTTASGYYQINVQMVCDEGDLIKISFDRGDELPIDARRYQMDEFIRVDLDFLTQEVNVTAKNHIKIVSDSYFIFLPNLKWAGIDGSINKDIVVFNFKSDDIEVEDMELNNEPINLVGYFTVNTYTRNTISGKFEAYIDLQNKGETITISRFGDNLDGEYVIVNFMLDSVENSPNVFIWKMGLEKVSKL